MDRAADLLLLKTAEILDFPNNLGLIMNHLWVRNLRLGDVNVFAFKRGENKAI